MPIARHPLQRASLLAPSKAAQAERASFCITDARRSHKVKHSLVEIAVMTNYAVVAECVAWVQSIARKMEDAIVSMRRKAYLSAAMNAQRQDTPDEMNGLCKRKIKLDTQIYTAVDAILNGMNSLVLTKRLNRLEAENEDIENQMISVEKKLAE